MLAELFLSISAHIPSGIALPIPLVHWLDPLKSLELCN